jgi:hypothetical protein
MYLNNKINSVTTLQKNAVFIRETYRLMQYSKIIVVHCDIKTNALSVKQSFKSKQVVHRVTSALEIINDRKHSIPETRL